jgi:hypothetical protein
MNSVASFIFKKAQKAFAAVFIWNLIAPLLFLTFSGMSLYFGLIKIAIAINTIAHLLIPTYTLGIIMHGGPLSVY